MIDPLASQLATAALTSALGIAVGWAMGWARAVAKSRADGRREELEERDTSRAALRELFLYRLQDIHAEYVVGDKPCSVAEKHRAEEAYRLYHDKLGGNGTGTQLYNEIMALHVE